MSALSRARRPIVNFPDSSSEKAHLTGTIGGRRDPQQAHN